jgi:hypothetical protein
MFMKIIISCQNPVQCIVFEDISPRQWVMTWRYEYKYNGIKGSWYIEHTRKFQLSVSSLVTNLKLKRYVNFKHQFKSLTM